VLDISGKYPPDARRVDSIKAAESTRPMPVPFRSDPSHVLYLAKLAEQLCFCAAIRSLRAAAAAEPFAQE